MGLRPGPGVVRDGLFLGRFRYAGEEEEGADEQAQGERARGGEEERGERRAGTGRAQEGARGRQRGAEEKERWRAGPWGR